LDFPVLKDLELFVPVACVQSFDQDDEAVRLANATDFGLGAALFTKDLERAKRIASHLEAGMVAVNAAVASDVRTPFGGVKHSGFGRELGEQGVLEFARWKTLGMA
jgi:succinate-semialdehyde dehydrogenase/glutarate-semialdehyde dehydrogenase